MSRKSAAAKSVAVVTSDARMKAPSCLTLQQKRTWRSVVNAYAADYFRASDVPMLIAYVTATQAYVDALAIVQREGIAVAGKDGGASHPHPLLPMMRAQAGVAAKMATVLRIAPSSRYSADVAATKTNAAPAASRPWDSTPGIKRVK